MANNPIPLQFAKFNTEAGTLSRMCPLHGADGLGRMHTNLPLFYGKHQEQAAEDGYFPVVYTERPEGYYTPSWELQEIKGVKKIVQVWTEYTPEPEPPMIEPEKLRADVDYIAMMLDLELEVAADE